MNAKKKQTININKSSNDTNMVANLQHINKWMLTDQMSRTEVAHVYIEFFGGFETEMNKDINSIVYYDYPL